MRKRFLVTGAMALALAVGSIDAGHAAESFDAVERQNRTEAGSSNAVVSAVSDIAGNGAFSLSADLDEDEFKLDDDYGYARASVQAVKRVTLAPGSYTAKATLSGLTGTLTESGTGGASASVWMYLDCVPCAWAGSNTLFIMGSGPLRDESVSNGTITPVLRFTVPEEAGPTTVGIVTSVDGGASATGGFASGPEPRVSVWYHGGGASSMQLTGVVDKVVVEATPAA